MSLALETKTEDSAAKVIAAAEDDLKRAESRLKSAATAFYRSRKAVTFDPSAEPIKEGEHRRRLVAHEAATKAAIEAMVRRGEALDYLDLLKNPPKENAH